MNKYIDAKFVQPQVLVIFCGEFKVMCPRHPYQWLSIWHQHYPFSRPTVAYEGPLDFCVFKEQILAFSNPHSVTIAGTAHSLKRISESNGVAVFQKIAANLEITLTIRHSRESKKADGSQIIRHNVELTQTTWDVNGKPEVTQTYVVSRSRVGADPAVVTAVLDALGVQVDAQSASIVDSDVGP